MPSFEPISSMAQGYNQNWFASSLLLHHLRQPSLDWLPVALAVASPHSLLDTFICLPSGHRKHHVKYSFIRSRLIMQQHRSSPRLHRFPHRIDYTLIPAPLDLTLPMKAESDSLPAIIVTPSSPSSARDFSIAFLAPPPKPTLRQRLPALSLPSPKLNFNFNFALNLPPPHLPRPLLCALPLHLPHGRPPPRRAPPAHRVLRAEPEPQRRAPRHGRRLLRLVVRALHLGRGRAPARARQDDPDGERAVSLVAIVALGHTGVHTVTEYGVVIHDLDPDLVKGKRGHPISLRPSTVGSSLQLFRFKLHVVAFVCCHRCIHITVFSVAPVTIPLCL
ncbi:hypothetical protein C8J57DRAFT_1120919 [Mycena rebaudengoi]|nr:hypothetical protein C8J57DRAFT_1120919 [Mycena rebaudengoi]